jgi:glycosyltransferase involved in cell wall biosynthesis
MSIAPRLSIGLPVYNGEEYLADSLNTLLGQSYDEFELIISDNASTDSTGDICRQYGQADARIRYIRQPDNIGSAANHRFVLLESRGELFKWASADDLYAPELLERCVAALDERDEIVLAHSWTAGIDSDGKITQAVPYPLATDAPRAPDRLWGMLFGVREEGLIAADDQYGVIRTDVLRRVPQQGGYYSSDRTLMTEVCLYGPFYQAPDWLYFRREHPGRPQHTCPNAHTWSAHQDPSRANRLRHPAARLYAEYILGYVSAIRRAPLSPAERRECYRHLAHWVAVRTLSVAGRTLHGGGSRGGTSMTRRRTERNDFLKLEARLAQLTQSTPKAADRHTPSSRS